MTNNNEMTKKLSSSYDEVRYVHESGNVEKPRTPFISSDDSRVKSELDRALLSIRANLCQQGYDRADFNDLSIKVLKRLLNNKAIYDEVNYLDE